MRITLVVPSLNDPEIGNTVRSFQQTTSGTDCEMIVVDDCSRPPIAVGGERIKLIKNPKRIGVGGARHLGAEHASGTHVMFVDAHTRFRPGWHEAALDYIKHDPEAVWCGECQDFQGDGVDWSAKNIYQGAQFHFFKDNGGKGNQVFECTWKMHEDAGEMSGMMGACYIFPTPFFFKIGGLKGLRMWGADEPYLSLKTWLAGGKIRFAKRVRIAHKFWNNKKQPFQTAGWNVAYNKARSILTTLNEAESEWLMAKLKTVVLQDEWNRVETYMNIDMNAIVESIITHRSAFVHDAKWFCDKFKMKYPFV